MRPFREVELEGTSATGRLFLHPMPGRFESIREFMNAMRAEDLYCILCLASEAEIRQKSPGYEEALTQETFRKMVVMFPIEDYGAPEDAEKLTEVLDMLIAALDRGRNVVVHCGAGVGRTGTVAVCLLIDLGLDIEEAVKRVKEAESEPENDEQKRFVIGYHLRRDT